MLISREPKFIFIHNYKTGGTSIQSALMQRKFGSHAYFFDLYRSNPRLNRKKRRGLDIRSHFNHFRAYQIRDFLGAKFFDSAFKFGFVRNPWDFEVSFYNFIKGADYTIERKTGWSTKYTFRDYIKWKADNDSFVKQHQFFFEDEAEPSTESLMVDFIGRYETFDTDLKQALSMVNIHGVKTQMLNVSPTRERRDYRSYYDYNTAKIVEEECCADIEAFGYDFDKPFGEEPSEPLKEELDVYGMNKRKPMYHI